jgi:hypothetical protein
MQNTTTDRLGTSETVAWLNDLLQLDHDAVAAYQLALRELDSPRLRSELEQHLHDHERHIEELERHLDRLGGLKFSMPHATGAFKLAIQAAAALATDRKVLLAFKANEMQARDKYARAAGMDLPIDVRDTIRRAAADESRHYDWAVRSLRQMGASEEDMDVRATKAVAHAHGRAADAVESAERGAMRVTEKARRAIRRNPVTTVVTASLAVLGAGVLVRTLLDRD